MVGLFLRRTLLLGLPILLGIALYAFAYRSTFPAPRVTKNISLNEKLRLFKRTGPASLDVIAVGSSMTLNNLSSRAVKERFADARYLNFGTWGFALGDTRRLISVLQAREHARVIIVCSNLMEFSTELVDMPIDTTEIARYVWREDEVMAYLRRPLPSYYLRQMESNRIRASDPGNYEYLRFDEGGGSTLNVPPERHDPERWMHPAPPPGSMVDSTYSIVADIGRKLRDEGTRLIWVHAPFRDGLMDDALRARVQAHTERLRSILVPLGHIVLDGNDRPWSDSLYSDYSHLNADGAYIFTQYVLAKLDR